MMVLVNQMSIQCHWSYVFNNIRDMPRPSCCSAVLRSSRCTLIVSQGQFLWQDTEISCQQTQKHYPPTHYLLLELLVLSTSTIENISTTSTKHYCSAISPISTIVRISQLYTSPGGFLDI